MSDRIGKAIKYFQAIGVNQYQVSCLQSLVGDTRLTAAFKKQLEDYLHVAKGKVKDKEERAGRRALMLLHILTKPDLTSPSVDWKAEREAAWGAVDTLISGAAIGPVAKQKAEIIYRFNNDQVSWLGMMRVTLSAAWDDIVTQYGNHMDGERKKDIGARVGGPTGMTFQECPQGAYRTKEGLILGLTTPTPSLLQNSAWPRIIKLVRGIWDYTTALHEMMHFCCHDNFWNVALGEKRDPLNPASSYHEGVTEYFTRKVHTDGRNTSYETQVSAVKLLMQMTGGGRMRRAGTTENELIAAYFGGQGTDVFQVTG